MNRVRFYFKSATEFTAAKKIVIANNTISASDSAKLWIELEGRDIVTIEALIAYENSL